MVVARFRFSIDMQSRLLYAVGISKPRLSTELQQALLSRQRIPSVLIKKALGFYAEGFVYIQM